MLANILHVHGAGNLAFHARARPPHECSTCVFSGLCFSEIIIRSK